VATYRDIVSQYIADIKTAVRTQNFMSVMKMFSEKAVLRVEAPGQQEQAFKTRDSILQFHKSLPRELENIKVKLIQEDMGKVTLTYQLGEAEKRMVFAFDPARKIISARLQF
jgi:DNA-binding transcriptional regulator GbsR (MarR family)